MVSVMPPAPTSVRAAHLAAAIGIIWTMATACGTAYSAAYDIGLTTVERPNTPASVSGEPTISSDLTAGDTRNVFRDSLVRVRWTVSPSSLAFELENRTDERIRIMWDDATYMDPAGVSHGVIHRGVRFEDRNRSQDPTNVGARRRVQEVVIPKHLVYFRSTTGWGVAPILQPSRTLTLEELEGARDNVGKRFTILLPLEIRGTVHPYLFNFRVNQVNLPQRR